MTERYCPRCRTEVEDVGGFCLLGHSLRLQAVTDRSLVDLRAEVDKAFEEARLQVAAITGEIPVVRSETSQVVSQPPAVDSENRVSSYDWSPGSKTSPDASGSPPRATPPPPPPPLPENLEEQTKSRMRELWADFEEEVPSPADPIAQFAPSARMDWGPEGSKLKGRPFRRS